MSFEATCKASQALQVSYCLLTCHYPPNKTTGKHCCLWCLVTSEELKSPPSSVGCRTAGNIVTDFSRFQAAGGDLKKAKEFNNCVREPFLKKILLTQVGTMTLHSPQNDVLHKHT